jgi:leucyl/phenylalanyl-tRNA--protein transferase
VLNSGELHVSRSLRRAVNQCKHRYTLDTDFAGVIRQCAVIERPSQDGTWITDDMVDAYTKLHELGFAHSMEAWEEDELVGGLYGVSLGRAFFGESMFALRPNASKIGFVKLVQQLDKWGIHLVDAQVHTPHLERFGATHWPRARYLEALAAAVDIETRRGRWCFDAEGE